MVPMTMAIDHNTSMYFLLSPEDFISLVEATPSGRSETKIAIRNAIFTVPPAASVIPSAAFSGMLFMTDAMIMIALKRVYDHWEFCDQIRLFVHF